jgi:hypothetical protein
MAEQIDKSVMDEIREMGGLEKVLENNRRRFAIDRLLDERETILQQLSETAVTMPGDVSAIYRKCGKSNCSCFDGEGHPQIRWRPFAPFRTFGQFSRIYAMVYERRLFRTRMQRLFEVDDEISRLLLPQILKDESRPWTPQNRKAAFRTVREGGPLRSRLNGLEEGGAGIGSTAAFVRRIGRRESNLEFGEDFP